MKGFIAGVLITLLVIVAGFYLTVKLGLFPIAADNPPGAYEKRIANMALDNYVDKHAPKQENPTEINSANLIVGVREYEEHCALCHGGYNNRTSPMSSKFNPPVPQLLRGVPHDPDANFYWITKHGIRLTAMPSWDGILEDDEIWKVVAFLKHQDKLPPDVQAAWQAAANEHNPAEHQNEMEERREHEHAAEPAKTHTK
jgi:mono/diheme cytochrome c family protein